MSKQFRSWKIDEAQLLPARVQDYVPRDHLSRLILALVQEELDLSAITGSYRNVLGQPPFDPRMMTGAASAWLRERHLVVAADRQGGFRAAEFHDDRGGRPGASRRPAGFSRSLGVTLRNHPLSRASVAGCPTTAVARFFGFYRAAAELPALLPNGDADR